MCLLVQVGVSWHSNCEEREEKKNCAKSLRLRARAACPTCTHLDPLAKKIALYALYVQVSCSICSPIPIAHVHCELLGSYCQCISQCNIISCPLPS